MLDSNHLVQSVGLTVLANAGPACQGCPQATIGQRRILPEMTPSEWNGIVFVGESPWKDEMAAQHPFAGASGHLLESWLRRSGLNRREVAISNVLWCKPPHLDWFDTAQSVEALSHCHSYLEDWLKQIKPKAIVALGAVAFKRLTGLTGLFDKRAPRVGYVHQTIYGPVIGSPHPSYIMQGNWTKEPYALLAIKRAKELAHGEAIQEFPSIFVNSCLPFSAHEGTLMLDIETETDGPEDEKGAAGKVCRIGTAWRDTVGHIKAASEPWLGDTNLTLQNRVSTASCIAFWNQSFDKPRLEAEDLNFDGKPVRDAMLVWHFLQPNLPKALGYAAPFFWRGAPWKHLSGENPALYNGLDAWMQLYILDKCIDAIGPARWQEYINLPEKVLAIYDHASRIGLTIDTSASTAMESAVDSQIAIEQAALHAMLPETLRPLKVWKRQPTKHPDAVPLLDGGWGLRLPFLVDSHKQVRAAAAHFGITLPDTNEKTLAKHPHPFLLKVLELRKLGDAKSSFILRPTLDGAVHTQFSYHPKTWRKSTRSPNLQSLPARHPLTTAIRKQIVARPGHVFVAGDSAGIEAVLVGYLAKSDSYIRLAKAGVHGWLTAAYHEELIPLDAPDLTQRCKAAKKAWPLDYDRCKRIVHGTNYLETPNGIFYNNPGTFASIKDAAALQRFYLDSVPGREVVKWQRFTLELAKRQTYLETLWGVRNFYQRALVWNPRTYKWEPGEQAKEAVAFCPQSMASSIQDVYVLALPKWLQDAIRLVRHDEILLEVPQEMLKESACLLHQTMTMPIERLGGLTIGVELKSGSDANLEVLNEAQFL